MCGIFGTRANPAAQAHVIQGLNDLSYRGYDSWGIATQGVQSIQTHKQVGLVPHAPNLPEHNGDIAIGHTRWSTHGEPSEGNAHPHLSYDARFAVVHNGIVENHLELRKICTDIQFQSETDSEVIAHLIARQCDQGLEPVAAIRAVAAQLHGRYAFLVLDQETDQLIALRRGSPLIVGLRDAQHYVASDVYAISRHATKVIYLADDQLACCNSDGVTVLSIGSGERVSVEAQALDRQQVHVSLGDYPHYMRKEIDEQPRVLSQPGTTGLSLHLPGLADEEVKSLSRVIILGCGTSWHAGLVAEYWIEQLAGLPVEVEYASEFRYRKPPLGEGDCVVAISQSGETADTNAAVELAKEKGATIVGVCNVVGSTLTQLADVVFYTQAGPEIGVASTKAFTSQLAILYQVALSFAQARGMLSVEDCVSKQEALQKIPEVMKDVLKGEAALIDLATRIKDRDHALFLGRGVHFPIALEGALKLKEVSYIHAEGYPAAEMKHGPIALIDAQMPVVFIATKDQSYQKVLANISEVKSRGGYVIVVASEGDSDIESLVDEVIWVPQAEAELMPFITVLPLQLLAYHVADIRGCNVDKPRNLAKSVTVE